MNTAYVSIANLLRTTENDLRRIIAEAANHGDYEGVDFASQAAGRINQMISELRSVTPRKTGERQSSGVPSNQPRKRIEKRKPLDYPRFYVQNDLLHKVGWSKKENNEYIHKIPKDVFNQTVSVISDIGNANETLLTSERIIEKTDLQGSPVPAYQVYLTLAFLREHGVITKEGRDGYRASERLAERAQAVWNETSR